MSIHKVDIDKKLHVATGKKKDNKPVAIKHYQAERYSSRKCLTTDVCTPSPNELALVNGSMIKYFLENRSIQNIESVCFRFQIRMDDADDILTPTPYFFDRLEIYNRSTGQELTRIYADVLFQFMNILDQDHVEQWAELCNYDSTNYKRSSKVHKQGTTRYYYLPLVASFFDGMHLDLSSFNYDLEFRFHPANGGPTTKNAGTPKLLEVACLLEEDKPTHVSSKAHRQFLTRHVTSHQYLDTQQYIETGRVMVPSTRYEFDLDQFDHVSAAIVVLIRPTNPTNQFNRFQEGIVDLYDGQIDHLDVSGTSLYGDGRQVKADYLRKIIAPKYASSQFYGKLPYYPIMYGDLSQAYHGSIHGSYKFDGSKQRLSIETPAQGNGYTRGVTFSAAPVSGSLQLNFKIKGDSYENYIIIINANKTQAEIQADVDNLTSTYDNLYSTNLKFVVTGDSKGTGPVFFEAVNSSGQPYDLESLAINFGSNSLTDSEGAAVSVTTFTYPDGTGVKAYKAGWGSVTQAYDVYIYSLYFRDIQQNGSKIETFEVV